MIDPFIPLSLIFAHWLGDWPLQSNWMAQNKKDGAEALFTHVLVYSLVMLGWTAYWAISTQAEEFPAAFILFTFGTHWLTDFVTSKWTSHLWFVNGVTFKDGSGGYNVDQVKRYYFFNAIGVDQLIHFITLAFLFDWLLA